MKKIFKVLSAILLCFTFIGLGVTKLKVEATTESTSYSFASKSWTTAVGQADWTSIKEGYAFSNNGIQILASTASITGNSPISFTNITEIEVTYCTNASAGVGGISIYAVAETNSAAQSGTQIDSTFAIIKPSSGGTTAKTTKFTSTGISGFVQLHATCSTNSVYIIGIKITTTEIEPETTLEEFAMMKTMSSMVFSYIESDPAITTSMATCASIVGESTGVAGVEIVEKTSLDNDLFSVIGRSNSASGAPAFNATFIRLYCNQAAGNGSSLEIYSKSEDLDIKSVKVTFASNSPTKVMTLKAGSTLTSVDEVEKDVDTSAVLEYNYIVPDNTTVFTLQNTRTGANEQVYIESIKIIYESIRTSYALVEDSAALRFGTAISVEMYEALLLEGTEIKFGVDMEGEVTYAIPVRVASIGATEEDPDGDYYQFAIVLKNIPTDWLEYEFIAKVFVEIDGTKTYMKEAEYSVITLAQAYVDLADPVYADYMSILRYIAALIVE